LLWEGQYLDSNDRCIEVNDDILKIVSIIGLSAEERALLQNYHFMSSRLAGIREIRSTIRHVVFNSRICYRISVFLSFTPSKRHSGLALRLYRGRRADPAYARFTTIERQCLDYHFPSLSPHDINDSIGENVVIDLPDYDSRWTLTARDPLCCVYAFQFQVFIWFQMVARFSTLLELGWKIEEGLLSASAMKDYINYTRCASYPDVAKFTAERHDIEKQ